VWALTGHEQPAAQGQDDAIRLAILAVPVENRPALVAAFDALEAENRQLRLERDNFEQRLHAYKSGEIV